MGIPKMFRWLSERYPLVSQLVEENAIPEFDNLYLDMNGIVHNATHANKGSHLMLTDEKMFSSIFSYIEDLFERIQPKKVFYMAVDGVAPRAKMNQQRARRFRTAQDREKEKLLALKKGIVVSDDAFDSNCITPGTVFMEKLTQNLKYFINKKISEDEKWQKIEVILSSHEVPGEGEHKIMEYIRACKAQPNYNPNLRHCLYGLDADLIMLGLLSHDPHFALLREEVAFGKKAKVSHGPPRFFLLHLSLVREYIDSDFSEVKGEMKFDYNLEKIIDDLIMMIMFVGNDFLPHLPGFDIADGVLTELLRSYAIWLKTGDGYINNDGVVNFKRLEQFLRSLDRFEYKQFLNLPDNVDILANEMIGFGNFKITENQLEWTNKVLNQMEQNGDFEIQLEHVKSFKDIEFIKHLAADLNLHLNHEYEKNHEEDEIPTLIYSISNNESDVETETEDESLVVIKNARNSMAFKKVVEKYLNAPVVSSEEEIEDRNEANNMYIKWKKDYYQNKLEIDRDNKEEFNKIIQSYIEGIQWVIFYYYHGIRSWGWYYPYHYAPMLSDLVGIGKIEINFEQGTPFKPFEQLMGVLPPLSKTLVPQGLRELMTNPMSTIIDFYPMEFDCDLNGKKNSWEAVVKIPFIDEKRLLAAIKAQQHLLTKEEVKRNSFGNIFQYKYNPNISKPYKSSLPGYLSDILTYCEEHIFNLPKVQTKDLKFGLCPGVEYGPNAPPGFPSIFSIPINSSVKHTSLTVFDRATKSESVIIDVVNPYSNISAEEMANQYMGKCIFIGYPFLHHAKLVKIMTLTDEFIFDKNNRITKIPVLEDGEKEFRKITKEIEATYKVRKGVNIGTIDKLLYYAPFISMVRAMDGSLVRHFAENLEPEPYPSQLCVFSINKEDPRYQPINAQPIEEVFPLKCKAFFLGDKFYGTPCQITGHKNDTVSIKLLHQSDNLNIGKKIVNSSKIENQFTHIKELAKICQCSSLTISKLTSRIKLSIEKKRNEIINLGLGLKFENKGEMVLGYCQKGYKGWEFSPKACQLVTDFCRTFPEFIQGLENQNNSSQIIPTESIYPENTMEHINKIQQWHKENGIKELKLSSIDSELLDNNSIIKLQVFWDQFYQQNTKIEIIEIHNVPRSAILKHSDEEIHLSRQKYSLGDRVVYIKESSKVPITLRGTVIGSEADNLEILFDRTFHNGTNLDGRCEEHRGLWVQKKYLLNLSDQQLSQSNLVNFMKRFIIKTPTNQKNGNNNNNSNNNNNNYSNNNYNNYQQRNQVNQKNSNNVNYNKYNNNQQQQQNNSNMKFNNQYQQRPNFIPNAWTQNKSSGNKNHPNTNINNNNNNSNSNNRGRGGFNNSNRSLFDPKQNEK